MIRDPLLATAFGNALRGKTIQQARRHASKVGIQWRISKVDGEPLMLASDVVPWRVNFVVETGKIVDFHLG